MEFSSADPTVIRSVKQRELFNTWLRALDKSAALPLIQNFQPDRIADELADMMGFDVVGQDDGTRFLITQEGARLAATYGNEHTVPAAWTNRYLDDAIGPARYSRVVFSYRTCVARQRPTYSISTVRDADGKDVSYERLLLPFGRGCTVEQIVGSYKAISIEGGFKITNLMGIRPKATPVYVVRAVIDRQFVHPVANDIGSDNVIEL